MFMHKSFGKYASSHYIRWVLLTRVFTPTLSKNTGWMVKNKKDWYSIQNIFHWFWHFCESHFWMHCSELVWIRYVFLSWKEFLQHRPALPVYADFMKGSLRPGKVISSVQLDYISLLSWWRKIRRGKTTTKGSSSILWVTN